MALGDNLIGLAVGKVQAENRGLQPPESTRIGVISAMMSNPIMSLVISRSLADNAVAALPPPPRPPVPTDGGTGTPGGQPQTDFERSVTESLATIKDDITKLKEEVASLKPPVQPPPSPGGQAAPSEPPAREAGGKLGKGGGTQ
ncbi:MAG: hypothetical protein QOH06_2604 [Acidobacteriota bacterium]|jgi:hypothetical protein|nr:hypothetical protein [Acidobacteriota bacterium]